VQMFPLNEANPALGCEPLTPPFKAPPGGLTFPPPLSETG
jgi:hypothetical protein